MLNVILIPDNNPALEELARLLSEKDKQIRFGSLQELMSQLYQRSRSRLIVRRGMEHLAIRLEDVALFYTENKIVYLIDRTGKKYLADKHLTELEQELDRHLFFRANRQYIVNVNFIKGFKPYEKVKLVLELALPELAGYVIIISQENAPLFREWMYNM